MRIEGQLERAEQVVRTLEQAEDGERRAQAALELAQAQATAAVRAQAQAQAQGDKGGAAAAGRAVATANAAVSAAQGALERARRELGTVRAARDEMVSGLRRYVSEQGRAASGLGQARAAAPYGAEELERAREQALRHAETGNRVLQILGADAIALEAADDAPPPAAAAAGGGPSLGGLESALGAGGAGAGAAASPFRAPEAKGARGESLLDGYVADFRTRLREKIAPAPPAGLLYGPPERAVGFDELVAAQGLLDEYENRLAGQPGAQMVMGYLREACEEELAPRGLGLPPRLARDRGVAPKQGEHCNPHPHKDVEAAHLLAQALHGADSPEGAEAAWRYADQLEASLGEIGRREPAVAQLRARADERYYAFCDAHDLGALDGAGRAELARLQRERGEARAAADELRSARAALSERLASVTAGLDPSARTSFVGLGGSRDFSGAYDALVTAPQGYEHDDVAGCCGIGACAGMINEQTGSRLGWAQGIDAFLSAGRARYEPGCAWRSSNGGTSLEDHRAILESRGLSVDSASRMSLDEMLALRLDGRSIGIGLRAEDLACAGLAPRNPYDEDTLWGNHFVTVAGFSVRATGEVAGVWINDTGGWAGSGGLSTNRIFLSREKFERMQEETLGFTIEWAWAEDPDVPRKKLVKTLR